MRDHKTTITSLLAAAALLAVSGMAQAGDKGVLIPIYHTWDFVGVSAGGGDGSGPVYGNGSVKRLLTLNGVNGAGSPANGAAANAQAARRVASATASSAQLLSLRQELLAELKARGLD